MHIPSYDELTPSIPDITPGEVFAGTAPVLPRGGPAAVQRPGGSALPPPRHLFAALHGPAIAPLVAIARDFSPRLERHAGGTVVLDVTGLQRLLGDAGAIAGDLARAGAPRVAVAATYTAAMLLARTRPGITVATGDPGAALHDVPIVALAGLTHLLTGGQAGGARVRPGRPAAGGRRMPLGGPAAGWTDMLGRWGLTTLGDVAALPADGIAARLGAEGLALQRLARGVDPRPLVPDRGVRRFTGACELEWPIETLEPLSFVFARLLDPLAAALERADRGAVALQLALRLTDRTSHVRMLQWPAPMRDPRVLRTLLLLDLESHPPPAAIDTVWLELDPAPARIVQYSLLERALPSAETLATLLARLGALVGETRCGSPVPLETHRPDAFEMCGLVSADSAGARVDRRLRRPGAPAPASEVRTPAVRATGEPLRPPAGRQADPLAGGRTPARATGAPLALDAGHPAGSRARAPAPGHAEDPPCVLRRFRPPVAIRVAVEGGRPVRVAIDRQGMPGGVVQEAAGPWRTSGGWWESARWNRDEWDVALSDGAVCRLFRDRDGGQWFMDGVYD